MGALVQQAKFDAQLQRMLGVKVYFDTNPIIYALEAVPDYVNVCASLLKASQNRDVFGFTGAVTQAEMLVKPLREQHVALAARVNALFGCDDIFTCVDHSREAFVLAATLRATQNYKLVDALQLATAIVYGCKFFVSNDAAFKSVDGLEVVLISAFID